MGDDIGHSKTVLAQYRKWHHATGVFVVVVINNHLRSTQGLPTKSDHISVGHRCSDNKERVNIQSLLTSGFSHDCNLKNGRFG